MLGERLKELRNWRMLSLEKLSQVVGKSASTLSRYESDHVAKPDFKLIKLLAEELETSPAYLLGMTDDPHYTFDVDIEEYASENNRYSVLVTDEDMSPEIPCGAIVKIRPVSSDEELQAGSFYYIEFNNKKCFRMATEDDMDGLGFLPNSMNERRIAYDLEYVTIIGKAVSMKVFFDN